MSFHLVYRLTPMHAEISHFKVDMELFQGNNEMHIMVMGKDDKNDS